MLSLDNLERTPVTSPFHYPAYKIEAVCKIKLRFALKDMEELH